MLYKTMMLELLQSRPQLHRRLRQEKLLRQAMEIYAKELSTKHESWKQRLAATQPASEASQIASAALELALVEVEASLPSASSLEDADRPSLDEWMTSLRANTLPA